MFVPATSAIAIGERQARREGYTIGRALVISLLVLIALGGFMLRAYRLSAEGLSEDELNKLRAVEEYRRWGITSVNGEHPMLMKGILTFSVILAERWNRTQTVQAHPSLKIPTESALRLPGSILGALSAPLIFILTAELFGSGPALIAAALWAFDPTAIGFNRIAKEDTFFLFFFLLANIFWLRGQRAAETQTRDPEPFYWATAAAFGAMLASKYIPHFLAVSAGYYHAFQELPETRWRLGKRRWLLFFIVLGGVFLLCNPAILLPDTWREMRTFAGESRIGHDAYEFMGHLYHNQMSLWLKGVPWTFYYVFIGVKLPILTLLAFIVGLPALFTRRLGDGRLFVIFWLFFWFFPFTLLGGKFTRYFTVALPAVLIVAALGVETGARSIARRVTWLANRSTAVSSGIALVVISASLSAAIRVAPHYRLFTNALGGGMERAGSHFPHDEFYDASVRDVAGWIAVNAPRDVMVLSETPGLMAHYLSLAGRGDVRSRSLSDQGAVAQLKAGDLVIIARGRRYFSNEAISRYLSEEAVPAHTITLGAVPSAYIFVMEETTLQRLKGLGGPIR